MMKQKKEKRRFFGGQVLPAGPWPYRYPHMQQSVDQEETKQASKQASIDVVDVDVDLERDQIQAEQRDEIIRDGVHVEVLEEGSLRNEEGTTKTSQQPQPQQQKWMRFACLLLLIIAALVVIVVAVVIETSPSHETSGEGGEGDQKTTTQQPLSPNSSILPTEISTPIPLLDNSFCNQAYQIQLGETRTVRDFDTMPEGKYSDIVSCEQVAHDDIVQEYTTVSSIPIVSFGPAYYFAYHHLGPDNMPVRAGVSEAATSNNDTSTTGGFPVRVYESCNVMADSCLAGARFNNGDGSVEWQATQGVDYVIQVQRGSSLHLWTNTHIENAFLVEPEIDDTEDRVPSIGTVLQGTTFGLVFDNESEDAMIPACGDASVQTTPGVWYKLKGIAGRPSMTATTCGDTTNFDTQISVFATSSTDSLLTCVAGNNDGGNTASTCGEKKSVVSWSSSSEDEEYFILVHGFSSGDDSIASSGNFELGIRWDFPPSQPIQLPGFP